MASFVYNIYDSVSNEIDCYYQFWHVDTNRLSDIRTSVSCQISFDTDDADIDNQENPFKEDEIGILMMWTGTDNRDDYENIILFGYLEIISTGATVYVGECKLYGSIPPVTELIVSDSTEGIPVICSHISSDEYQIDSIYHRRYYNDMLIFPNVGIALVEYSFNESDYTTTNYYTFDETGEYTISILVKNYSDQEATDQKTIKIYNNPPVVTLSIDPEYPRINEEYTITVDINDETNVTNKTYYLNNEETSLTSSINSPGEYTFKSVIEYYDGFENKQVVTELPITLTLSPPIVELEAILIEDNIYNIEGSIIKGDGEVTNIFYKIYYTLPFSNNKETVLSVTHNVIDLDSDNLELNFQNSGEYVIEAVIYDDLGSYSIDSLILLIDCTAETTTSSNVVSLMYFDKE